MEVYVVVEAIKDNMSNDWERIEYYRNISCSGVYKTLELAAASYQMDINKFVYTNNVDDTDTETGVSLGGGWIYKDKDTYIFIIKQFIN